MRPAGRDTRTYRVSPYRVYVRCIGSLTIATHLITAAQPTGAEPLEGSGISEEILVTGIPYQYRLPATNAATRTFTPLEQIPQSVTIVTRKLIDDQQVNSVAEALRNVSGVVTNNTLLTPAFDNTMIRGFASEQLVDGFTQYYNPGDRDSTVNVDNIAVLKGPSGLLYGGGSGSPVGGVINITSKIPHNRRSFSLGTKLGPHDYTQGFIDVNQPLTDKLLFRITGEYTQSESEIDVLDQSRYNINPTWLLTNNAGTNLTLGLKTSRWEQQDYQGLSTTGTVRGDVHVDPYLFVGPSDIEKSRSEFHSVYTKLDHIFDDTWSGNLQMRYAESEFEENVQTLVGAGFDFGADIPLVEPPALAEALGLGQLPFGLFNGQLFQKQEEQSIVANLIAQFDAGAMEHTLLLGADYSRYDDSGFINTTTVGSSSSTVDLANPVFNQPYVPPGPGVIDNSVENTVYGEYLQLQTTVARRLHLLAGIRYGTVKIVYDSPGVTQETKKSKWIPRIGAVYDLHEGISLFAGASEGMRGQPFALFVTEPEPEQSSQGEIGIKFNLFDQFSGQLAYFSIERENVAVPTPNPEIDGGFGSVPEGKQSSSGYEAEALWQPIAVPGLSLLGAFSHVDASFEDDLFAFASSNDALPGVPENSGRVWINYEFQRAALHGLQIGAGIYAQDATRISLRNDFMADDYYTIDTSASYKTKRWVLGATIKNLTDNFYYDRLNYLGGRVAPAAGRELYLSAVFNY